ncbi:MAG: Crp/Fnr family transcriptional regulator [Leptolyngbya sp. SIO4C1]|nr:Crp/Fnr family transcriptional regulator [Leptolyngbya sp. SIO4C1]
MVDNRLLKLMSPGLYRKLEPHLTQVALKQGAILNRPGEVVKTVYFPTSCLLSITLTTVEGTTAEVGLVGKFGMLGINACMGYRTATQTEYVVQIPGSAISLEADLLRQEFQTSAELRDITLCYAQAFIAQLSQTTACNRLHSLEQRFARWLLEAQSRIESKQLSLTHSFIADMLGVRRAGVTQAAQKLQERGIIQYRYGNLQILDLAGLELVACECFHVVETERERLFEILKTSL